MVTIFNIYSNCAVAVNSLNVDTASPKLKIKAIRMAEAKASLDQNINQPDEGAYTFSFLKRNNKVKTVKKAEIELAKAKPM